MRLRQWFYDRIKFRLKYTIDKEAMVAFIDVNKPDRFIAGDDRTALDALIHHFTTAGYCVIVRDK